MTHDYQLSHSYFKTGMLTEFLILLPPKLGFFPQPKTLTAFFCFNSQPLAMLVKFRRNGHILYHSLIQGSLQPSTLLLLLGIHSRQEPMLFPEVKDLRPKVKNVKEV